MASTFSLRGQRKSTKRSLLCILHIKVRPNALTPNNTLGLPELLTIDSVKITGM